MMPVTAFPLPYPAPELVFGTAMWGWNIDRPTAFALLDEWYGQGFRQVDTATNYPIDKDPAHFRLAEKMLCEWIKAHGVADLQVTAKVGSVNNLFTPEHVLTKSFLLMMLDEYRFLFGKNLHTLMVHWDNRDDPAQIAETVEVLAIASANGLRAGLSGIRHPHLYHEANSTANLDFRIQIKHNILQSDHGRYAPFHGARRFMAYSINAGGLKWESRAYTPSGTLAVRGRATAQQPEILEKLKSKTAHFNAVPHRPPITGFFQVGLICAYYHPDMESILVGPSSVAQLRENISFYRVLGEMDYSDVAEAVS